MSVWLRALSVALDEGICASRRVVWGRFRTRLAESDFGKAGRCVSEVYRKGSFYNWIGDCCFWNSSADVVEIEVG